MFLPAKRVQRISIAALPPCGKILGAIVGAFKRQHQVRGRRDRDDERLAGKQLKPGRIKRRASAHLHRCAKLFGFTLLARVRVVHDHCRERITKPVDKPIAPRTERQAGKVVAFFKPL